MKQSATLLGATGLTGGFLLKELLEDADFSAVNILTRSPVDISSPKLQSTITDFNDKHQYRSDIGNPNVIFCCIGTTMKKVKGDKRRYREIDVDIPVDAAIFGAAAGVKKYVLISALGANSKSSIFYNNIKGQAEDGVISSGIPSIHIFRPSLLTGPRNEKRTGEGIAEKIMKIIDPFLKNSKYHSISTEILARAMKNVSKSEETGVHYYTYKDILRLAAL
jgi:uncharacterized protein YbjT (DUF2867 family)